MKSKYLFISIALVAVAGFTVFMMSRKHQEKPATVPPVMAQKDLKSFEQDMIAHNKRIAESEEVRILKSGAKEEVHQRIANPKSDGEREKFLQTILHYIQFNKTVSGTGEQKTLGDISFANWKFFIDDLTKFFEQNKKPASGARAGAVIFAIRIFCELPVEVFPKKRSFLLGLLRSKDVNNQVFWIALEELASEQQVDTEVSKRLKSYVHSKDATTVVFAIRAISKMTDAKQKKALADDMVATFSSAPENAKAYFLTMFFDENLADSESKTVLQNLTKATDESLLDVSLQFIKKKNYKTAEAKKVLEHVQMSSTNPNTKMNAQNMIAALNGATQ